MKIKTKVKAGASNGEILIGSTAKAGATNGNIHIGG
jgi:hypothetical protein